MIIFLEQIFSSKSNNSNHEKIVTLTDSLTDKNKVNKSDQNNYFRHGLYLKPVISDLNLNLFLTSFFLITWLKFKIKNLSVPMEKILPKQSQKPLDISRIYHRFIWINIGQSTNKGTSSSSLISLTVILICHLRKQHNLKSVVLSRHNRAKGRFKKTKHV